MRRIVLLSIAVLAMGTVSSANHAWGNYHWARTNNPFTVKLGNNVSGTWQSYLSTASSDWTKSTVLDTTIVTGQSGGKRCRATTGRVEVCNDTYGRNGWLGVASISVSGSHITAGTVKLNDTYFNTAQYNTPGWRQLVACQEIGHTFGLDHQDETFDNVNLGTCMDYTNDPDGPPSNLHPDSHDYDELQLIYSHLDTTTTVGMPAQGAAGFDDPTEWGRLVRRSENGRLLTFERDFGGGFKIITFVFGA